MPSRQICLKYRNLQKTVSHIKQQNTFPFIFQSYFSKHVFKREIWIKRWPSVPSEMNKIILIQAASLLAASGKLSKNIRSQTASPAQLICLSLRILDFLLSCKCIGPLPIAISPPWGLSISHSHSLIKPDEVANSSGGRKGKVPIFGILDWACGTHSLHWI